MSAADLRNQLRLLELERLEAAFEGLLGFGAYKRDLDDEMAERRSAFVSAAGRRVNPNDCGLPRIVRALGHVAAWAGYHAAGTSETSRPPARLSYHSSESEPAARVESH
jgi:hypothetical protein